MRASTYAILIAVWLMIVGPVCVLAPMAVLTTMASRPGDISLAGLVAAAWIVLSILVLARPRASELFVELIIRSIAWLIIGKCLFAICWPGLISWLLERYSEFPGLVRCMGIINVLFGLWMFSLAGKLKHAPRPESPAENP